MNLAFPFSAFCDWLLVPMVIVLGLALPLKGGLEDTDDFDNLPLFDGHAHLMPTWGPLTLPALVEEHGTLGMVLLGTGPVWLLQSEAPNTFVASAHVAVNAEMESKQDSLLNDLLEQLNAGARGIGEISIRHFSSGPHADTTPPTAWEFNHSFFLQIYQEADDRGVPINFHFDYDGETNTESISDMPPHVQTMSATLSDYPEVRFIWAHAGDAQPAPLQLLLAAHPNLYIDISSRNPLESFERAFPVEDQRMDESDGTLKETWKDLMESNPDRVLFGSDIGPKGRLEEYEEILSYYRGLLSQLEPETAALIGYQNALNLYFNTSLTCDFQGDGLCNADDIDLLYEVGDLMSGVPVISTDSRFDLDQSGTLDHNDLSQWLSVTAHENGHETDYRRGDTEFDRDVDISDFNALADHFDPIGDGNPHNGPLWGQGNFDGDDDTDISDFNVLAVHFAPEGYGASVIPEPSSWLLATCGLVMVTGLGTIGRGISATTRNGGSERRTTR